jgi:hypothetical protein
MVVLWGGLFLSEEHLKTSTPDPVSMLCFHDEHISVSSSAVASLIGNIDQEPISTLKHRIPFAESCIGFSVGVQGERFRDYLGHDNVPNRSDRLFGVHI